MPTRREIMRIGLSTAAGITFAGRARPAGAADAAPIHATAVTRVFGDGQRLVAVALEYPKAVAGGGVGPDSFAVEGRTVTSIEAGSRATGGDDRIVTIELSPDDPGAVLNGRRGRERTRREASAVIVQTGPVRFADGETLAPDDRRLSTDAVRNLVVDDFRQFDFTDPETGTTLGYNLFTPRALDPSRRYPLVLFMHDAGATSAVVTTTLVQGLGAVVWASPEDQAERPAFVLAPQYSREVVNDRSEATSDLAATVRLVRQICETHPIDRGRIYATGQSGGAMLAIAINIAEPDLFAASFLVAGQWDPEKARPLARKKLWIVVSQGDLKAYPGENAMVAVYEEDGAKVARAVWNGRSSAEEFAAAAAEMVAEEAPINYAAFAKGTVVPPGQADDGGGNHVNTWRIAYAIPGIRSWIFDQRL